MSDFLSYFNQLSKKSKRVFVFALLGIFSTILIMNISQSAQYQYLLDNIHWSFGTWSAALLTYFGYKTASADSKKTALLFLIAFSAYGFGQFVWDIETLLASQVFPAPSDAFYIWLGPLITAALFNELYKERERIMLPVFFLDLLLLSIVALTITLISYLPRGTDIDLLSMFLLVSYPVSLIIPIIFLVLMIVTLRIEMSANLIIFLLSLIVTASCWMSWNSLALDGLTSDGSLLNVSFSISILFAGLSASNWKLKYRPQERCYKFCEGFLRLLPLVSVILTMGVIVFINTFLDVTVLVEELVYFGSTIVIIIAVIRQSQMLQEREKLLDAQKELLKSANLIHQIINTVPMRVFWKDKDLHYLGCNDLFAKDAGFESYKDMLGKNDFEMTWRDEANLYREDDFAVINSGKPRLGYEEPQTTPEGKEIWLRTSKVPLIDSENEEIIGILGVYDDITYEHKILSELEDSERFLRQSQSNAGIGSYDLDMQTMYWRASDTLREIFGIDEAYVCSLDGWVSLIYEDDRQGMADYFRDEVFGEKKKFDREYRIVRKNDNSIRWLHGLGKLILDADGRPTNMIGTVQDITERKNAERQIHLAASVFRYAHEGIMITDSNGVIVDVNNAFTSITGYEKGDVIGKNPNILNAKIQSKEFYEKMWNSLIEKGYWSGELWNRTKSGKVYAEMLTISSINDSKGDIEHYIAIFSDITAYKEHEKQLTHIAHYDVLTGLPNRVLNSDRLRQAMVGTKRSKKMIAVIYLDLDGFKEINDLYGHSTGDKLLIKLSQEMKKALRAEDTLSRLGGDEFVAILSEIDDASDALLIVTRLLGAASSEMIFEEKKLHVSASLGMTFYPQTEEVDADQLIRQADQAMYEAKQTGKNRYYIFDSEQNLYLRSQNEQLEHIHEALGKNEFVLYYQPKVNILTGSVTGVEALIRWNHPQKGILTPATFLPTVENHSLCIEIGNWVLNEAIAQAKIWKSIGLHLPVSVNVGAKQLLQGDFTDSLRKVLSKHENFDTSLLEIEILETSALEDIYLALQIIQECKEMGIRFALDDFGTGYSSLTYLKKLPISTLKIDQSFVRDMLDDSDDLAILEGIVGLASSFDLEVIAEGVETYKHGEKLLALGCNLLQGYGIARPMPAEKIQTWCNEWEKEHLWLA